jgi:D-xylose transport system substrate-binding protein
MRSTCLKTLGLALAMSATSLPAFAQNFDVSFPDLAGPVYVLVPSASLERYAKFDVPNMTAQFKHYAPNVEVRVLHANDQVSQQVSQMDAALANGAIGVILIGVDPSQTGGMLARAAADNVPVVTFAQGGNGGPANYHVTVPFEDIGFAQGEYLKSHLPEARPVKLAMMLGDPNFPFYVDQMVGFQKSVGSLIEDGTIKIVCQADALLWNAANSQRNMEQCLSQTGNEVDGVFVMQDGTGTGVMAALLQQDLQGKIKIFGSYDATLEGVQRVLLGWQAANMAPPYRDMDEKAVVLTLAAAAGVEPPAGIINGVFNNGFADIPASLTNNVFISTENFEDTVIGAGLWTRDEICTAPADTTEFCTK